MKALRAIRTELFRSFDLRGRTARGPYLWFLLASISVFAFTIWIVMAMDAYENTLGPALVVTAVFYVPVTSAGVRRLHDVGESGIAMLAPLKPALTTVASYWIIATLAIFLFPVMTFFVAWFFGGVVLPVATVGMVVGVIMTLACFTNTMSMLLLPSQPSPNKYGPNPHEVT